MDPSDGQNYAAKHLPVSSKHGVRAFFADMIKALKACWAKPR
jgi:uroporphyrinogen-III synthase